MTNSEIKNILANAREIAQKAEASGLITRHFGNRADYRVKKDARVFSAEHRRKLSLATRKNEALKRAAMAVSIVLIAFQSFGAIDDSKAVRAIVGEAANQGRSGMLAVAGAIRNRGTLKGVYGVKNPAADKQPAWVWQRAREAWAMSATNDISHAATHWENTKAFGRPYWAKSLTVTTNIGSHTFYR